MEGPQVKVEVRAPVSEQRVYTDDSDWLRFAILKAWRAWARTAGAKEVAHVLASIISDRVGRAPTTATFTQGTTLSVGWDGFIPSIHPFLAPSTICTKASHHVRDA